MEEYRVQRQEELKAIREEAEKDREIMAQFMTAITQLITK